MLVLELVDEDKLDVDKAEATVLEPLAPIDEARLVDKLVLNVEFEPID